MYFVEIGEEGGSFGEKVPIVLKVLDGSVEEA
jgi:hypothetical protein